MGGGIRCFGVIYGMVIDFWIRLFPIFNAKHASVGYTHKNSPTLIIAHTFMAFVRNNFMGIPCLVSFPLLQNYFLRATELLTSSVNSNSLNKCVNFCNKLEFQRPRFSDEMSLSYEKFAPQPQPPSASASRASA